MAKVIVAGSLVMDVVAGAPRFPHPGETILGTSLGFYPGGKGANQALAAAKIGITSQLVGRVGQDSFGAELLRFLKDGGVDLSLVRSGEGDTGVGLIVLAEATNAIVMVPGANSHLAAEDLRALSIAPDDVVVAQLEIPLTTVEALLRRGRTEGAKTILNAAPALEVPRSLVALADILVVNEIELEFMAGRKIALDHALADVFAALAQVRTHESQIVCATLGGRGFAALIGSERLAVDGHNVPVVDTTGAGDCFVGALAARLAEGSSIAAALTFANTAASLCVQRMGAGPSMPLCDDVIRALG